MVRADLRKAETDAWRARVGGVIERVRGLRGWTLKEFAAAVDRDERQLRRWTTGEERPQFDAVYAIEELQPLLALAFAELAGQTVKVRTLVELELRRVG
jgi:transcriptional regulator with XRE-family HTH domain